MKTFEIGLTALGFGALSLVSQENPVLWIATGLLTGSYLSAKYRDMKAEREVITSSWLVEMGFWRDDIFKAGDNETAGVYDDMFSRPQYVMKSRTTGLNLKLSWGNLELFKNQTLICTYKKATKEDIKSAVEFFNNENHCNVESKVITGSWLKEMGFKEDDNSSAFIYYIMKSDTTGLNLKFTFGLGNLELFNGNTPIWIYKKATKEQIRSAVEFINNENHCNV